MSRVYIETSVPSYLTARRSNDLIIAADQELTTAWWNDHRSRFILYTSDAVLKEAAKGDPDAAAKRLGALDGITVLDVTDPATELAEVFLKRQIIPAKVLTDALHIALATVHGLDFVVTWNCKHIANAEIARQLETVCNQLGYRMPALCTPKQLMGD